MNSYPGLRRLFFSFVLLVCLPELLCFLGLRPYKSAPPFSLVALLVLLPASSILLLSLFLLLQVTDSKRQSTKSEASRLPSMESLSSTRHSSGSLQRNSRRQIQPTSAKTVRDEGQRPGPDSRN